jgi:hypothetical protein
MSAQAQVLFPSIVANPAAFVLSSHGGRMLAELTA